MKNSNNKNENSNEKIENSNEKIEISNEKLENSNEKIEKILQNSNKKNDNSNEKIENSNEKNEKIPYYKRYYQKHKEEIKAKRLKKLKEKQEQENQDLKVVDVNKENEIKTTDKIKIGFWSLTQEAIIGIFILSLIVGLIVYKWFFKKDNENQEVNE